MFISSPESHGNKGITILKYWKLPVKRNIIYTLMICGYLYRLQGPLFIIPENVKSDQTFLRFPERIEVIDHYYLGVTVTLHWFNQEAAEGRSHGGHPMGSLMYSDSRQELRWIPCRFFDAILIFFGTYSSNIHGAHPAGSLTHFDFCWTSAILVTPGFGAETKIIIHRRKITIRNIWKFWDCFLVIYTTHSVRRPWKR